MIISKINANYATSFGANQAVKSPARTIKFGQKEVDVKKVGIAAVGLTAAALAALAAVYKVKNVKTVQLAQEVKPVQEAIADKAQAIVSNLAQIPAKKGEKISIAATSEGQKLANLINTSKIQGEIAQVEAKLAKHDELQKFYEEFFAEVV